MTVGTGSSALRLDRRGPCTLVRAGSALAAVDLGAGALQGLMQLGVRPEELDALFLTHLHPDHTGEVVSLLNASNYGDPPRSRPLLISGGIGTSAYLSALRSAHSHWLDPGRYGLHVRELRPGEQFAVEELRCRTGPVRHTPSSLAYRFSHGGRTLVVGGDTGPSPELEAFAAGADVLVLEASRPTNASAPGHLTPSEAGELAKRAGVGKLVLHHFTPASDACSPAFAAAESFGGPVIAAADGQRFPV